MKKLIFVLLISISVSTNLFSQKKLGFGLYLGSSITSLSGADEFAEQLSDVASEIIGKDFPMSKAPRSLLFYGGGFVSYNLSNWLALKGGVEYAPKGETFNGECYLSTDFNMNSIVMVNGTILKIAYVEFPLSVQLSTLSASKPDKVYFYANFGISPAVKVFSKMSVFTKLVQRGFDSDGTTERELSSSNLTEPLDGIKGFDFGMFCSVGVSDKTWFCDLKYDHGLTNINEDNNSGLDFKNRMIALSLGVKF
jgi:hypothetical protein